MFDWFKKQRRTINLERCTVVVRLTNGRRLNTNFEGTYLGEFGGYPMVMTATERAEDRIEAWGKEGGVLLGHVFTPMHRVRSIEIVGVRSRLKEV